MYLPMAIHTGIARGEGIGLIAEVSIAAMTIGSVTLLTQLG